MAFKKMQTPLPLLERGFVMSQMSKQPRSSFAMVRLISIILLLLFVLGAVCLPSDARAVTRTDIPTSQGVTSATAFLLGTSNSPQLVMRNGTDKADFDNHERREIVAKISSGSGSWTVKNPATITYANSAKINGRGVDVKVNIDSVTFKKGKKDSNNGFKHSTYVTFAHMSKTGLFIGTRSRDSKYGMTNNANGYTIKTSITFTWNGTNTTVPLPFIQGVYDIDQQPAGEAWEANSGYSSYIVYQGTNLSQSGNKFFLKKDYGDLNGTASQYKGGLYATTSSGTFSSTFYGGNCDSQIVLYNQFKQLNPPNKTASASKVQPGDKLDWSVTQKIGTYIKDSFTGYSEFSFSDTLDQRLEYVSACMYDGDKDISTNAGTLKYDAETRTVSFAFKADWLANMANYKGQNIKLVINTKVKEGADGSITNTALIRNSGVESKPSATVVVEEAPPYAATGTWIPAAQKTLEGADLQAEQFTFQLKDASGNLLQTAQNDPSGRVSFEGITFDLNDAERTHEYTITEVNDNQEDITYDESSHRVSVALEDNKDGTLKVVSTYPDDKGSAAEFVNYALAYEDDPYPVTGGPGSDWWLVGIVFFVLGVGLAAIVHNSSRHKA
ncbi:MAG: FctA domain-containing protein [Coriobacteriia bacterium]|nr:FctA domain-containing protein [Coriobacteriia bacterium]